MQKSFAIIFIFILFLPSLQAQTSLTAFTPEVVTLDAAMPFMQYTVDAESGETWSFSAVTVSGDLDPVLRLYDDAGILLLANDNETRRSTDARIENWTAPQTGTYTLELTREGDERARTSGDVRLTALRDENSLALSPLPKPQDITLAAGETYKLVEALPREQVMLQFEVNFNRGEAFHIQIGARWTVIFNSDSIAVQQLNANSDGSLFTVITARQDVALTSGFYTMLMESQRLQVRSADREFEVSLPQSAGFSLSGASLTLAAAETNTGGVRFREPYASAPFYTDSRPVSQSLPPVMAGERLYAAPVPLSLTEELRDLGYIEREGWLVFNVQSGILETSQPGFSSLPLEMAFGVQDFVLHFATTAHHGSGDLACGMMARQTDAANFLAVLLSADGSAYLLPYHDGALTESHLAVQTPWIESGFSRRNTVTLVAQGGMSHLFVNGVLVGTLPLDNAQPGKLALSIYVGEPAISRCTYDTIWLWSLD